jgi:hypothetical protein
VSPDLALQKALRARLAATAEVTALVATTSILDRNERPVPVPSIILGETQLLDEETSMARAHQRVFHTVHVWRREEATEGVKAICWAVRRAVHAGRLTLEGGFFCADLRVQDIRVMRDPDGVTAHGVVTVNALIAGAA